MVWRRLIAGLLMAAWPFFAQARPVRFAVVPEKTDIIFTIDAVGFPTTRGAFRSFKGAVIVDIDNPSRSSVTFTVTAASVDARSRGLNDMIIGPSFLEVRRYPTITFASTGVAKRGEQTVEIIGNLTLLGVTRPARFSVTVERRGDSGRIFGFVARGDIRRSEFGMTGGFPIVADRVSITVMTETVRSE